MKAEEFIKEYTRGCSNELVPVEDKNGKKVISYHEWLTPDQALRAVEIAREEVMQQMMKDAIDTTIKQGCTDLGIFVKGLDENKFSFGDRVKVIIVKEDLN